MDQLRDSINSAKDPLKTTSIVPDTLAAIEKLPIIKESVAKMATVANTDAPNWADQLSAWSTLAATILAAVGALLAWRSYKHTKAEQQNQIDDQQKQLDKLALIAERLEEQHRLERDKLLRQFRPFLQVVALWAPTASYYAFKIENIGGKASKFVIMSTSPTIELALEGKPNLEIKPGGEFQINFYINQNYKNQYLRDLTFEISLAFQDIEHNRYQQILSYEKEHWSISTPELINSFHQYPDARAIARP